MASLPVVFHSEGWSKKTVIVFVVLGSIVKAWSVRTTWGFAVIYEVVLICIAKCGKCMRPCVVSMTTLFFLISCNPMMGPVSLFNTTKCTANVLSPLWILSVAVANGFSNWPFATCLWKLGGLLVLKLFGAFCLSVSNSFWAIALIWAPESTKASVVWLLLKSRCIYSISCLRLRFM